MLVISIVMLVALALAALAFFTEAETCQFIVFVAAVIVIACCLAAGLMRWLDALVLATR